MFHLAKQAALQTDQIPGHHVIHDLPAAVLKKFVTKAPSRKNGVKMRIVRPLDQDGCALLDREIAFFETTDEIEFVGFKITENIALSQRTFFTR